MATSDPSRQSSVNPHAQAETPEPPVSLEDVGNALLEEARGGSGRAARTLTPTSGGPLKQTLIALTSEAELSEHTAPGPASIVVWEGRAVLVADGHETPVEAGTWAPIPEEKHSLRAEGDVIALLTVVPNP